MTIETLNKAEFSDIKINGHSIFACLKDDAFGFKKKNINVTERTVCCGLAKSCTIRY